MAYLEEVHQFIPDVPKAQDHQLFCHRLLHHKRKSYNEKEIFFEFGVEN